MCVLWQPVLLLDPGTEHCALPQRSEKKKKHIFRSIFFSIKKMSSFLSTIMKEGKYLLQMLLNRVRQRV